MKKLFTLCLFTMALFLGTQSIFAQEDTRSAEEIAKVKTYKLTQEFNLDKEQHDYVWRAFLNKEKAKQEIAQGNLSQAQASEVSQKADKIFYKLMKEALSEQQYFKFEKNIKEYL